MLCHPEPHPAVSYALRIAKSRERAVPGGIQNGTRTALLTLPIFDAEQSPAFTRSSPTEISA